MKYIDADRLRAEIEKRKQIHFDDYFIKKSGNPADYGASNALAQVLSLIDSLQQEQPQGLHFTPLNRLIQKIPSENWNDTVNNYAKKLCDCLINEGFRKDAEVLQGYISYMNGNNVPMATMDEQECQAHSIRRHNRGNHAFITSALPRFFLNHILINKYN